MLLTSDEAATCEAICETNIYNIIMLYNQNAFFQFSLLNAAFQPLDICARIEKHSCQALWRLCSTGACIGRYLPVPSSTTEC